MTTRAMKSLLTSLGEEATKHIQRPAEPQIVMEAFCRAMSVRTGRPIDLVFRPFPPDVPVSGLRLDLGERSMIVVDGSMAPEAQLVILGHELHHEANGDCHHDISGMPAAARAHTDEPEDLAIQRAAELILTAEEVPLDAVLAVAARAESIADHERNAETFGLLFCREVRTWVRGPYAQSPTTAATVEGRLQLSLGNRSGLL
ncbi:toxin [Streptomyces griseochromogenes]|uniref:toxin n=1 Tax=Streptomyces griseochromogenes TaxID=68214 RepID=UPI0037A1D115